MERRQFVVSSALGTVGLWTGRLRDTDADVHPNPGHLANRDT